MVGLQTRGEWAGAFRKCCIELGISYMMAVKEWLITVPPLEANGVWIVSLRTSQSRHFPFAPEKTGDIETRAPKASLRGFCAAGARVW